MGHPFWPLFDLEVRTPSVTLRYLDDELALELIALAKRGVHDPGFMPFAHPWTDLPSPQLEHQAQQFYWRTREQTSPESWNLLFATVVDGVAVGSTNLGATGFPVRRWFETGSWLGREFQGQGIGTEMRIATLHLGFIAFDALMAGTGAFDDNVSSLGVTRKLGYEPNGIEHAERRGEVGVVHKYRMTRDRFTTALCRDDIEIVGDAAVRDLLGIAR